jgi:hypothetical protein
VTWREDLIAVEAQTLTAPLELLGRGQATEGARRRRRGHGSGRQGGARRDGGRRCGVGWGRAPRPWKDCCMARACCS